MGAQTTLVTAKTILLTGARGGIERGTCLRPSSQGGEMNLTGRYAGQIR